MFSDYWENKAQRIKKLREEEIENLRQQVKELQGLKVENELLSKLKNSQSSRESLAGEVIDCNLGIESKKKRD